MIAKELLLVDPAMTLKHRRQLSMPISHFDTLPKGFAASDFAVLKSRAGELNRLIALNKLMQATGLLGC